MKIQTFKDGDRFVVVFEGIEDVSTESIVKSVLSAVVPNEKPIPAPDALVEALPVIDETAEYEDNKVFKDGPYKDMTPTDILFSGDAESAKAYSYICDTLKQGIYSEGFTKALNQALADYLRIRFENTDAESYSAKLTDKMIIKFFEVFDYSIPKELKKPTRENLVKAILSFK